MDTRVAIFALMLLAATTVTGAEVDYLRDVKPVLRERCFACHAALKQESGLRVDTAAALLQGGDSGPAIQPGDVEASLLWERITAEDESYRMPPEGQPLTPKQIAAIRAWIEQGAVAPENDQPEADPRAHWAFQPPVKPDIPFNRSPTGSAESEAGARNATAASGALPVGERLNGNPIDAFLAAERAARNLQTVPLADRRLLLRRVYLDLIGVPPTREEVHAFLADDRPDAFERIVDRLLDSPHYGERWGRHWMDVWRYSDWYGLGEQLRNSQKHLWRWREWIVGSLNEDKGYDRMVLEMLAADEIAPTDRDALRATGFLARNYYLFNRTTWLDDTIEHTSKAFLGLTVNCAKCHDHKYDPISHEDYYRMRAIFEPHQVRLDPQPGQVDLEKDGLPRVFDAHPDAPTYLHIRGNEKQPDKERVIPPGPPAFLTGEQFVSKPIALPAEAHNPSLQAFVLEDHLQAAKREIATARQALAKARAQLASLEESLEKAAPLTVEGARREVAIGEKALGAAELRPVVLRASHAADSAKAQPTRPENLKQLVHAAAAASRKYELAKAEETLLRAEQKLAQADDKSKPQAEKELKTAREALDKAQAAVGEPGEAYISLQASLKALEGPDETDASRRQPYPTVSTGRRTALARWIVSRDNPLAARVAVNHIWMRHFGQPLVDPVTDFGRRTAAPPQQKLLDWLAVEFMESGWSMKRLHRLIVTSEAYRLSSSTAGADAATAKADPENHYYWRRLPMRMESQVIRDSLLHLAGALDPALGGPTIDPKQDETVYRRSLYFTRSRDEQHAFLSMFDDADILGCYRRSESILPQQALTLSNSKLSLAMARRLAARLQTELGDEDDRAFLHTAYETILGLEPTDEELSACRNALEEMKSLLRQRSHPNAAHRARENLVHALLNHNDFITIR